MAQSPSPGSLTSSGSESSVQASPSIFPARDNGNDKSEGQESDWMKEASSGTVRDKQASRSLYQRIILTLFSLMIVSIIAVLVLRYVYARQGLLPQFTVRDKLIKVVEKQLLMPQKALYLVEVAGKYVLLGISENRIDYLMEVEAEKVGQKAAQPEAPDPKEYLEKYSFPKPVQFLFSKLLEERKK